MKFVLRWLGFAIAAAFLLQVFFVGRIALIAVLDPESTSFQRSEAYRLAARGDPIAMTERWHQRWTPYGSISDHVKRAVIAAEDDGFTNHEGVDWDAMERAWQRNEKAGGVQQQLARNPKRPPKIVGGSTITQQLAKNLLLSGERTLVRKGQEVVLTFALEALLPKRRILEVYLNSVEWGEGVFGVEAASRRYFRKSAAQLTPYESARLAVMLPRPKHYERQPGSAYLSSRAQTIVSRMRDAELP